MNWAIKIISKTLMTKISHISWGGYDKGFCDILVQNLLFNISLLSKHENPKPFIKNYFINTFFLILR